MKTVSEQGVSKGIRILQIIVGIIAIALSIAVINIHNYINILINFLNISFIYSFRYIML